MGAGSLLLAAIFSCSLAVTIALHCYKCGEYNDGVGSITPCINYTHMKLVECHTDHTDCIKYISEGSVVRDCVANCQEKETWGSRTLCCNEHGCNSSSDTRSSFTCTIGIILFILAMRH